MSVPTQLVGQNGQLVCINEAGEVLISQGPYDLAEFNDMDVVDTAYNFYKPKGLCQFVVTGFLAYGDKDLNDATDSTVVIYEASAPDTATADRVLIQFELAKLDGVPFPNIRILCNHGTYINGKCADDDVHMTVFGHFVDLGGKGETQ